MSEQFDVILGGLDTEVDVTIADSTGVDPSVLLALRGEKGDTGDTGQNGADGADGIGIADISKTGTVDNVDTYTITYSNGDATTFNVTNGIDGVDGVDGQDGTDGADGYSPTATVTKSGDTATITITDINGTTTATVKDGTQANAFTAEFGTTTYADVKDAYDDDEILICTADDSGNTMVLQLVYFDATNEIFLFAEPNGDGLYWTELSNANGWDDGTRYLASTDVATQLRDGLMSALDWQKLDGIASGAEVNVQSDWNQSTNTADDYIKNKPTIPSKTSDLVNDSLYARGHIASFHGTCTTGAATAEKAVTCADFKATDLVAGAIIIVAFTATNSGAVASLTMNVNSTGAKPIKYINNGTLGNLTSAGYLKANTEYPFYYDGTNWVVWFNCNTTYSAMSEADMHAGTATTGRLITAQRLYQAVKYHAPVTSVNGSTGAVTVTVPTKTSDLTNDGSDGVDGYITAYDLAIPTFRATDATSKAVLLQAFGVDADIMTPSSYTSQLLLLLDLEPRTWFCWMNGSETEFARMSVSANTGTSTITLYLRGRTSIATGIMGVDSSWTISPLASDAEGVAY